MALIVAALIFLSLINSSIVTADLYMRRECIKQPNKRF